MPKKATKTPTKTAKAAEASSAKASDSADDKRRVKLGKYSSFKLQKSMKKYSGPKLPGAFKLLWGSVALLWRYKKVFGILILVYGIMNFVLVQGFSNIHDLSAIKSQYSAGTFDTGNRFTSSLTMFVYLLGSTTSGTSDNSASNTSGYGVLWAIIASLAIIWTLRQLYSDKKIRVRDAFYSGMYPLMPFILVLLVVILQLLPLIAGAEVYSLVMSNGIAVSGTEQLAWGMLVFLLGILSCYMISSSLFAVYVVCLPDMAPMKALRSARQLVLRRRWTVMRKVLFLPLVLLLLTAIIMLPVITFLPAVAGWLFFILCMVGLAVMHNYYYALYRSLL